MGKQIFEKPSSFSPSILRCESRRSFKLRWEDIDLEQGEIRVISGHTKTETVTTGPASGRAKKELEKLEKVESRVFPIVDFKRFWETTKRLAGAEDVRFLRPTADGNHTDANEGRTARHSQQDRRACPYRNDPRKIYTATDAAIVQSVREKIDQGNEERLQSVAESAAEFIN